MENKQGKLTTGEFIGITCGALSAIIGLLVIIGWVFHIEIFVRIHPASVPMMFNTALGLLFCGVALLTFGIRLTTTSIICGAFVTLLGMLSLLQYLFGVNLRIDNLFIDPYLTVESLLPGRMAPNTAVAFFLTGAAILLLNNVFNVRHRQTITGVLISCVGVVGITVLIGYAFKFDALDGWSQITRMAFQTAIGLTICGIGLFGFLTVGEKNIVWFLPRWAPLPIGVALATMTFTMWQLLTTQEVQNVRKAVITETKNISESLKEKTGYRVRPMERMAARIEEGIVNTKPVWEKDASLLFNKVLEYRSITLVDTSFKTQWFVLAENGVELTNNQTSLIRSYLSQPNSPARKSAQIFSLLENNPDRKIGLYIAVPHFSNKKLAGFILADMDIDRFLTIRNPGQSEVNYAISIMAEQQEHILFGGPKKDSHSNLTHSLVTEIYGTPWKIETWSTEQMINDVKTPLPEVVLAGGIALAILTALMVHFGLTAQIRARELLQLNDSLEQKVAVRTKELQERDEFTRQWLNKCTDGAFDWNLKNDTVVMTSQFREMLGYGENEIDESAESWRRIILPIDLPVAQNVLNVHLELGEPYSYQLRYVHKNGSIVTTLVRGQGIKDENGKTVRMVGTLTDISQLKRLEEELTHWAGELERKNADLVQAEKEIRASQKKFESLLQSAPDSIILVDAAGTIVMANPQTEKTFGYGIEELLGQKVEMLIPERFRNVHTTRHRPDFTANPATRPMSTSTEIRGKRKNGSEFPVDVSLSPVKIDDELFIISIIRDITAIQADKENLRKLALNLARSNKDLEQFAYVASHDLQEPLRTVASFVQLLSQRYQGKLDSQADEYIQFTVDGVSRMRKLINDLLMFSRVGIKGAEFAPTDCELVLGEVLSNLRASIEAHEAVITHDQLPMIMADQMQIMQVFQNLIGNAIKFKGDKTPKIHIGVKKQNSEWLFSVQDNGIGFEPEFSEKVFMIFQRLHTQSEYPGTGIGLSLCKKIIERHGGRIWVESVPDKGSTFNFIIPDNMREQNEYSSYGQADRNLIGRR